MRFVLVALSLGACGTTNSSPVPVVVPGQPALMTLKLGTGSWRALGGTYDVNANATTYQIDVTDDFELVGACTRASGAFVVSEVFGTVDDATISLGDWTVPDCVRLNGFLPPPSTTNAMFTVTADVDASIDLDQTGHNLQAGIPKTLATWQGPHDLIAFDPIGNRILTRHDVEIDGGSDLGTLAVGSQGEPLLSAQYAFDLQPDEGVRLSTYVVTARGAFHSWSSPDHATAYFVPPDQLAPGDVEKFQFQITALSTYRGATSSQFDGTVPAFDLLPRLTQYATQAGELGGSWTPFPDFYTDVWVGLYDQRSNLEVSKSKLWLDRHQTSTIDFDMDVDGYDPAWSIANPSITLDVRRWNDNITLYSGTALTPP